MNSEGRRKREDGSKGKLLSRLPSPIFFRSAIFVISFLLVFSALAQSAEPFFVTIQKVELKKRNAEWVTIIEPDHKVDLVTTEAAVSFFNNGRVPEADYENFRVTFDDHGTTRTIYRTINYERTIPVRKGSFIHVEFDLDLEKDTVKELRLTVDDIVRIDSRDTLNL